MSFPCSYSTSTLRVSNPRNMAAAATEPSAYKLIRKYRPLYHHGFHVNLAVLIADSMIRIKEPKRSSE